MHSNILLKIYYALFNSVATYGIIAWGGAYPNVINPLNKVQKKLIKLLSSKILKYLLILSKVMSQRPQYIIIKKI